MSAGTSLLICLVVCFLLCSCSAQENIPAELGQDVILPCKAPNINIRAVEWSRPDQAPEYVLFYRGGLLDPDSQHPSYQNRVDLQDKEMKDGDVSLILKNVTMEDNGRYECHVFQKGKIEPISITYLEVRPSGDKGGVIGDGGNKDGGDEGNKNGIIAGLVVGVILLALLVSVVFLISRRHMSQNQHSPVPTDEAPAIEISTVPESAAEHPKLLYL